jgi:transposase InsO family protein
MLRHDHGSSYMSSDFQDEIECLGIEASPSFVREPQGNGVAERFIRTLKENLLWARTFDTIDELRAALVEFATTTKPGSSPATVIVPQPRYEPLKASLIRTQRPI